MQRKFEHEREIDTIQFFHKIETSLCKKLGITSLRAGNVVIRDERKWRINEKYIEYCWLINTGGSFVDWHWLFTIKLNETIFRGIHNPDELIQGIFIVDSEGNIAEIFIENRDISFEDSIKAINVYDFVTANQGITLGGVSYDYVVFAPNTEIRATLHNPNSDNWKIWERNVWELGVELSSKSKSAHLKEIFN